MGESVKISPTSVSRSTKEIGTIAVGTESVDAYVTEARRVLILVVSAGKLRENLVARKECEELIGESVSPLKAPVFMGVIASVLFAVGCKVPSTGCEMNVRCRKIIYFVSFVVSKFKRRGKNWVFPGQPFLYDQKAG